MHKRLFANTGLFWVWIAVIVLALDRLTKFLAEKYLIAYLPEPIFPSFNLTLAYNKGAAFSLLDSDIGWQTWFFGSIAILVSIIIVFWLKKLSFRDRWMCIGLSLILGGALGNLWDRLSYGHVIDFIQLYVSHWYWPTFNIADSAVCIGAVMLLIDSLVFKSRRE